MHFVFAMLFIVRKHGGFSIGTAAYQTLQLSASYPWGSTARFANSPGYQATGLEERHISLSGTIYPTFRGDGSLVYLRLMEPAMTPLPMVDGRGRYLGLWIVKSVNETRSLLFNDGTPRKQDFTMELERYGTGYVGYSPHH